MKLFILVISYIFFALSSNELKIDEKKIELNIDETTTNEDISKFKVSLIKVNIKLNVYYISFNHDKSIKEIEIRVDCNDGFKGSSRKILGKRQKVGFVRNYDKNSQEPFKMF